MSAFRWINVCSLFLALHVGVALVSAGSNPLIYENNNADNLVVEEGTKDVQLTWENDPSSPPTLTAFQIDHSGPSENRTLGKLEGVDFLPTEVAQGYNLTTVMDANLRKIVLTIDTVTADDAGEFTCVGTEEGGSKRSVGKKVTVYTKQVLRLKFGETEAITVQPDDPIQEKAGTYAVMCISEGTNTSSIADRIMGINLNGEAVTLTMTPKIVPLGGAAANQFKTTVEGSVTLEGSNDAYEVECHTEDAAGKPVSTKLHVSVPLPENKDVTCTTHYDKMGGPGKLECTVDTTNMNVSHFTFQIGKTGEPIGVSDSDDDAAAAAAAAETTATGGNVTGTEGGNVTSSPAITVKDRVTVEKISATESKVTLHLVKVENWHLATDFYLVITMKDGSVVKETIKIPTDGLGSKGIDSAKPASGMVFIVLMAAWWGFSK